MSRCPVCREATLPRPGNAAFPFCGERCRLVDLGNWLGEAYRVTGHDDDATLQGESDDGNQERGDEG